MMSNLLFASRSVLSSRLFRRRRAAASTLYWLMCCGALAMLSPLFLSQIHFAALMPRTTTAPRPRPRARRTGVIATSRVVTTLSLASRARRASRETTTTTISSASPHSSLSPVSRARAVHRRGALCRETCPRGSSGLVKMDEMNYTTRSRESALSARTR